MSKQFYSAGRKAEGEAYPLLMGIGRKLETCATYAGLRELPSGELFRIGGNYCKCKACAVCSYLVSMKRKKSILSYFEQNPAALSGKWVYHMVFTLRHHADLRSGDYTEELKNHFKRLRDSRATRQYWKDHVEGGFYSMEVVANKSPNPADKSLHIHLHVIIISGQKLEETGFLRVIRSTWERMTEGSNQVFLDRVYHLNSQGEKVYYRPGMSREALERAFAESVKYTLKLDFDYEGISPETLAGLFKPHKRFFGFFGSLYGKGIASFSHEEISEVETSGSDIFSPSTGEVFQPEATRLLISPFWNLRAKVVEDCPVYELEDKTKRVYVDDPKDLAARLARINDYKFQIGLESEPPPLKAPDPKEVAAWERDCLERLTPAQRYHQKIRDRNQANARAKQQRKAEAAERQRKREAAARLQRSIFNHLNQIQPFES